MKKYGIVAMSATAALIGVTKAVSIQETHTHTSSGRIHNHQNEVQEQEVKVLVNNGNHIEMGIESATNTNTNGGAKGGSATNQTAQSMVQTEQKAEAHANLDLVSQSQADPDIYGPNGDNYQNNNPVYDFSRIKIDIANAGTGDKCREGAWISAHWVANLQQDGRVYSDTKQEGNGEPQLFTLGGHHVIKCLDIALTQLRAGAKAHIECPSFYAFGGALTQSFLPGGLPLPLHADVEYQLEVKDCNMNPVEPKEPPTPKKIGMQANRQMSLHIKKQTGTDLVLCCQDDEYMTSANFQKWPGIQCYLEEYIKHDPNQLWVWDDQTFYLKNVATGFQLTVANNRLIMADYAHINWNVTPQNFPWWPQWFEFCPYENVLETEMHGEAAYASVEPNIKLRNDIEIKTFAEDDSQAQMDKGIYYIQYEFKNW